MVRRSDDDRASIQCPLTGALKERAVLPVQRAQAQVDELHIMIDGPTNRFGDDVGRRDEASMEYLDGEQLGFGSLLADDSGHCRAVSDEIPEVIQYFDPTVLTTPQGDAAGDVSHVGVKGIDSTVDDSNAHRHRRLAIGGLGEALCRRERGAERVLLKRARLLDEQSSIGSRLAQQLLVTTTLDDLSIF